MRVPENRQRTRKRIRPGTTEREECFLDQSEMLDAAICYAELGFRIVPLWPGGKTPLPFPGAKEPTGDIERIGYWWELCPVANIGLPTGVAYNSLIVIDLDLDSACGIDGREELRRIISGSGLHLPETSVVRTGSGGEHYYFNNTKRIPLQGKRNYCPGIDVRAEGAHVVAPPSIHPNGRAYEWLCGSAHEIADATEDVYLLLEYLQAFAEDDPLRGWS